MRKFVRWMSGMLVVCLCVSLAWARWRNASDAAENGYYFGRLADGRSVSFSLAYEKTNATVILHVAGIAAFPRFEVAVSNRSDINFLLDAKIDSLDRTEITGFRGHLSGTPLVFSGRLITSNHLQGVALLATNIARRGHWEQRRGFKIFNRGGWSEYRADFPEFSSSNQFAFAITRSFAATARKEARDFITNGYENTWNGIKQGNGYSWTHEEEPEISLSWCSKLAMSFYELTYVNTEGAHPNYYLNGHNFVFINGQLKEVSLAELFRQNAPWEDVLSRICVRDLRGQEAAWVVEDKNKTFKATELSIFTLDEGGITIHFAPYEVGPYAQGTFHVFIPWTELRLVLNPAGPAQYIPGAVKP